MKTVMRALALALIFATLAVHAQTIAPRSVSSATTVEGTVSGSLLSQQQARNLLVSSGKFKSNVALIDKLLANESNEILVRFKDESPAMLSGAARSIEKTDLQASGFQKTRDAVRTSLKSANVEFLHEYTNMPSALVRANSRAALVDLINNPLVAGVVENVRVYPAVAQSRPLIDQPRVQALGHRGAGTTIAVIDDAADFRDPAFGSCTSPAIPRQICRLIEAVNMVEPTYELDPAGHGTSVAGIAARIAPGANIVSLDIVQNRSWADVSGMLRGIDWAISKQAQYNIVSVNLSLGIDDDTCQNDVGGVMFDAFNRLVNASILPVVAAGNSGKPWHVGYPACVGNAITVGALYDGQNDGKPCKAPSYAGNQVACWSNGGGQVTLFAPGAMINTGNGYNHTGTSQAAPHVAGAIAVLRGRDAAPNDLPAKTLARFISTAPAVRDYRNGVLSARLDLYRAIMSIAQDPSPTVITPPDAARSWPSVAR